MASHFALLFNTIHTLHNPFYPIQLKPMTLDKKVGYSVESKKKEKGTLNIFFLTYTNVYSLASLLMQVF